MIKIEKSVQKRYKPSKSNPTKTKCPRTIANVLNNHFTSVAQNLADNLAKTDCKHTDFMGKENKATMYLKFIELYEILEEINNICIKKAP